MDRTDSFGSFILFPWLLLPYWQCCYSILFVAGCQVFLLLFVIDFTLIYLVFVFTFATDILVCDVSSWSWAHARLGSCTFGLLVVKCARWSRRTLSFGFS